MFELAVLMITAGAVASQIMQLSMERIGIFCFIIWFSIFIVYRTKKGNIFALLLASAFFLGAVYVSYRTVSVPTALFGPRAFTATVHSVDRRLDKTNLVVRDTAFQRRIQLSTMTDGLLPGDSISIRGLVETPKDFLTDNGRLFGYRDYLMSKGIVGVVQNADVIFIKSGKLSFSRIATILRFRIAEIFARYVIFPIDGVVAGMLVGYQGGVPQSIQNLFRDTGVLHVLVLSGYNITLLAGFLAVILRHSSARIRVVSTMLLIGILVGISGSGVASIRAGIMGSIALLAGVTLHTYQPFRALVVTYLFFFFLSPTTIFFDPGFHLSFLATLFMILILPKVERLFLYIPKTRGIDVRELIMLALTVPLFMLPYTMYFSGSFPFAAPIANIILAIVTPLISIIGIGVLLFSWLAPVATIGGVGISYMGEVVVRLLHVSEIFSQWNTPSLPWWSVVLIYIGGIGLLFKTELSEYFLQLRKKLQPLSS